MGADISRVRFDPLDDFSGVVLQQGRLLLDGDFNEYVAVLDRRLRAETCDLTSFGPDANHQGVAWVPRLTPDGFRVTAAGGALTIGRGRMYVDGLLAENHGIAPLAFDPLLEGLAGTADTPYDKQPYWPVPDALPAGGPHLAYLDVWEREVTSVEDPGLVEVAVGVDTTARTQTVWQVRLLPSVPPTTTCATDDDDISGWLDVIRPSAGRLTTGTVTVAATDDPCQLPPSGGYRGLENQTYRVEVHTGGAPGTASFKWSRDNGSVVQPVVEMVSPTVLRLASLGRDDVLNIKTGNWVEILDDRYELGRRPGVMRRVTDDDVTERTVTFADPLPADLQPAGAGDAAARHLRVRRWDQSGVVRDGTGAQLTDLDDALSTGLITVPASAPTQVVLEHGAAVSFSVAAGGSGVFRAGDHWIFAARTADTSVEALVAAPPDGVHHHYARLGVVSFPDSETDCRRLWPPEPGGGEHDCSCTVCVTTDPNSITLQQAIDQVRATGGTVCLAAGVYDLGPGVTIDQARSVRIRGQGTATVLVARGTAIDVTSSFGLVVENLAVVSGVAGAAAIRMRGVVATTVENVVVLSYNADGASGSAIELSGVAALLTLRRNILVGRAGIDAAGKGEKLGLLAAGLRIEDNVVVGVRAGIDVGGRSVYMYACRITANDVVGGRSGAIVADGAVRPGGTLEVARNRIVNDADGIVVGCDAAVEANVISGAGKPAGDGIVVAESDVPVKPGHVRILANRVHDRGATAIALRTAVRTFLVKQNVVTQAAAGILVEARGRIEHAAIDNNELLDIAPGEEGGRSAFGILVMHAESVAVAGNTVARVAQQLREADFRAAIAVAAAGDIRISANEVDDVGPADGFLGLCTGIVAAGPFHHVIAGDNAVRPTAVPRGDGTWHALLIQSIGQGLIGLGPQKAVVETRSGALLVNGAWAAAVAPRREHVTVSANVLEGGGAAPTCLVRAADIVADANHCTHLEGEPRAVVLRAPTMTVSSNRVRGGDSMLILETQENTFAAVGNLAPAGTHLGAVGNGLPGPWQPLNPSVP